MIDSLCPDPWYPSQHKTKEAAVGIFVFISLKLSKNNVEFVCHVEPIVVPTNFAFAMALSCHFEKDCALQGGAIKSFHAKSRQVIRRNVSLEEGDKDSRGWVANGSQSSPGFISACHSDSGRKEVKWGHGYRSSGLRL